MVARSWPLAHFVDFIFIAKSCEFFRRSNSQSNPSSGSSGDSVTGGLTNQRKAKSIDRIPRLPDGSVKDATAPVSKTGRQRATWRVPPNRRASDVIRDIRAHQDNNKSPRTRSDGEVDVSLYFIPLGLLKTAVTL